MRLTFVRSILLAAPLVIGLVTSYFAVELLSRIVRFSSDQHQSFQTFESHGAWWDVRTMATGPTTVFLAEAHETRDSAVASAADWFETAELVFEGRSDVHLEPPVALRSPPWGMRPGLVDLDQTGLYRDDIPNLNEDHRWYHVYSGRYIGITYGWPMRAWGFHSVTDTLLPEQQEQLGTGPSVTEKHGLVTINGKEWPIAPVFPGVVVNTLFYASPWYLLIFGFYGVRRHRRRKLGRCVACNYDLAGLETCPECGRPSASPRGERGPSEARAG